MGNVGAYVHQVGDRLPAAPLGIVFEKFAHLEKQHHKHGFGKLGLGSRQKADEQCTDGGDAHEQVFIKRISLHDAFHGFAEHIITGYQIGHEINQQQLPCGKAGSFLYDYGSRQQHGREEDSYKFSIHIILVWFFSFISSDGLCFPFPFAKVREKFCNSVAKKWMSR